MKAWVLCLLRNTQEFLTLASSQIGQFPLFDPDGLYLQQRRLIGNLFRLPEMAIKSVQIAQFIVKRFGRYAIFSPSLSVIQVQDRGEVLGSRIAQCHA